MSGSVAVVGGGAAGMMAAVAAARAGAAVTVYEPMRPLGKKLRITGKGRCNVTNDTTPDEVLSHVTKNPKFLTGAVWRFPPAEVMRFFEDAGVPLKTERGRRVFPVSDRAADIAEALVTRLRAEGVHVLPEKVTGLLLADGGCAGVRTASGAHAHDAVIVATGGLSYPGTGSRGDGYRFAREAGLAVVTPIPSLVPIETEEDTAPLSGLSLRNVTLTVTDGRKVVFSELGEMLFTHFGVSGPLVLSASAHMRGEMARYAMTIDLKPALDEATLDARLVSDLTKYARRDFIHSLGDLLPQKLIDPVAALSGVDPHKKSGAVTAAERRALGAVLKAFPLTPLRTRPIAEAIVTSGGVDVKAIHPKTMMARTVPGLFFAGEVLDVDAYTGGYNLQLAFSTGVAAGEGAAAYAAARHEAGVHEDAEKGNVMNPKLKIAVDGPSGAGKSSLARSIARELGIVYVDTGALYRTIGLYMTEQGVDLKNAAAVEAALPGVRLALVYRDGAQSVLLNGTDVGDRIRTPEISLAASAVSAIPAVRAFLLATQREMAARGGVVMDGRDIGTVIMPDADVKIFLIASPAARARRRFEELQARGVQCSYAQILAELEARDEADKSREIAPAVPAPDALFIDNSDYEPADTLAHALRLIAEHTKQP